MVFRNEQNTTGVVKSVNSYISNRLQTLTNRLFHQAWECGEDGSVHTQWWGHEEGRDSLMSATGRNVCLTLVLTGKTVNWSCSSSTSFTSVAMFLLLGVCQVPTSIPRPGLQGRTLLANWRHSGHVNSPLSTEKPCNTWSFWPRHKEEK